MVAEERDAVAADPADTLWIADASKRNIPLVDVAPAAVPTTHADCVGTSAMDDSGMTVDGAVGTSMRHRTALDRRLEGTVLAAAETFSRRTGGAAPLS